MERKIKTSAVHDCVYCRKDIKKGSIAIVDKHYIGDSDNDVFCTYNTWHHFKCYYYAKKSEERRLKFIENCHHPEEMVKQEYSYIPGECVMEPSGARCTICGEIV